MLVVDDQPEIHRAIHRAMTHLGLSCTGVTKAAEAVDTYRRQVGSTEPFDVVVLDLTMPGDMPPEQLRDELRAIRADARIIATSGYSQSTILEAPQEHGFDGALHKPFGLENLRDALRHALSHR